MKIVMKCDECHKIRECLSFNNIKTPDEEIITEKTEWYCATCKEWPENEFDEE